MKKPWENSPFAIKEADVTFIREVVSATRSRRIVEIGCGYSTIVFSKVSDVVDSYETDSTWVEAMNFYIREMSILNATVRLLNGEIEEKYDLAFVDGPLHPSERKHSIELAAACAPVVLLHDYHEDSVRGFAKEVLEDNGFGLITEGGGRYYGSPPTPFDGRLLCALWRK